MPELIIFIVLFMCSILLLLLCLFKKLVFRPYYFILLAAALVSGFGAAKSLRLDDAPVLRMKGKEQLEQNLYISARLLEEDRPRESLRASGEAAEEAPEEPEVHFSEP